MYKSIQIIIFVSTIHQVTSQVCNSMTFPSPFSQLSSTSLNSLMSSVGNLGFNVFISADINDINNRRIIKIYENAGSWVVSNYGSSWSNTQLPLTTIIELDLDSSFRIFGKTFSGYTCGYFDSFTYKSNFIGCVGLSGNVITRWAVFLPILLPRFSSHFEDLGCKPLGNYIKIDGSSWYGPLSLPNTNQPTLTPSPAPQTLTPTPSPPNPTLTPTSSPRNSNSKTCYDVSKIHDCDTIGLPGSGDCYNLSNTHDWACFTKGHLIEIDGDYFNVHELILNPKSGFTVVESKSNQLSYCYRDDFKERFHGFNISSYSLLKPEHLEKYTRFAPKLLIKKMLTL